MFADEQAQDYLDRGGVTTATQCPWMPLCQVCFDLCKKEIIVKQHIQPFEHRIALRRYLRYSGKDIFFYIPLNKRLTLLLCLDFLGDLALGLRFLASLGWGVDAEHALGDLLPRLGPDELCPTKKGGIVWNPLLGNTAEPLQQGALANLFFGLLKTPIEELFEDKQAQDHFHRSGVASVQGS